MSRIIPKEDVKNDSKTISIKKSQSNSNINLSSKDVKSKESLSIKSKTEEKKTENQIIIHNKSNLNNIMEDFNSEYFSNTLEENVNNLSNYSAIYKRPYKKKKKSIRKLNSQNYDSRKNIKTLNEKNKITSNVEKINEVEEEEEEQEKKNLRQILDKFFTKQRMSILQLIISIIAGISFAFYVICTYKINLFKYMNYFDVIVLICFFLYYFIEITLAHHRILHILSLNSLAQFITMLPAFLCFITNDYLNSYTYMLANACRVFRFYRITNGFNYFGFASENNVKKQILMIVNTILNMIFIISGLMQIVERAEIDKLLKIQTDQLSILQLKLRKHFHHYLYYTIVSISTVGFGDISPYTFMGKIIFIILVFMILIVIQHQINDLISLVSAQSDYARNSYSAKTDLSHILLVGNISTESLKSFCQEFFHPDHGSQYRHAVILNPHIPPRDLEIFLHEPEIENFVFYLEGDPLNEKDLLRADVHKAKACVIFNDKNSKDPYSGDHQSLFLGIFIKKFVYNHNRDQNKNDITFNELMNYSNTSFHICLQLNKPDSISHFYNSFQPIYQKVMKPDQLIVIESLKMNLLSKSCITPGIMALITNLIMTSGDVDEANEEDWMKEYSDGRGHEIYRIQLKEYYYQFTFMEIVENIYNQGQVIAFALEIEVNGVSIIKLNPSNCSEITILSLIEKAKDFSFRKKQDKESYGDLVEFSDGTDLGNTFNLNNKSKDKEKEKSYIKYRGENYNQNNVKVFTYLICSDKSEADTVAKKEAKLISNDNINFNINTNMKSKEINDNNNIDIKNSLKQRKISFHIKNNTKKKSSNKELINSFNNFNNIKNVNANISPNLNNNIKQQENASNKGIFKELMNNINDNLNMQIALLENDSSSESEEDIDNENMVHFGSVALEVSSKDYHLIENQEQKIRSNAEIIHHSIKDREDISHHIIICGLHPALLHFILPLRAKYLQEEALKWIVILAPSLPQSLFEAFSRFNRIIFIQGSPLLPENLFRANVVNADKAVILSSGESKINNKILENLNIDIKKSGQKKSFSNEQILDAETIFIYKSLKKCNKNIQIMTELISTSNIEYLLSVDNIQQLYNQKGCYADYEYTPLYASGEIFTPSIIDCLTCQSYFNPHIVTIIEMLLGGQRFNAESKTKKLEEFYGLNNSNLYLIKIPDTQINEAFAEFYYFLLRHHSIAIALYRKNTIDEFYYVYTNPKKTTLLREHDFVFVLSNNNYIIELIGERLLMNDDESNNSSDKEILSKNDLQYNSNSSFNNSINLDKANDKEKNSKNLSKDITSNNNLVNNILKEEQENNNKIKVDYSKNIHFDRIQERINKIQSDLKNIKGKIQEFPEYIDETIDKELDNELNIYLNNQ